MTRNDDLRALSDESDWFVTITVPTPSTVEDARARFELEWRNARRLFSDDWDKDELLRLDEVVLAQRHGDSEALVIVHARHGSTLVEMLDEPVAATTVHEGPLPHLVTILEARQRAIAHVVVEADRAGADLTAFDGGNVLATESVEGDTTHIIAVTPEDGRSVASSSVPRTRGRRTHAPCRTRSRTWPVRSMRN